MELRALLRSLSALYQSQINFQQLSASLHLNGFFRLKINLFTPTQMGAN